MASKKRDEAEIEAVRAGLPANPPPEVLEEIKGGMKAAKLIYRSAFVRDPITNLREKAVLLTCTACGKQGYLSPTYVSQGCHAGGYRATLGFIDPLDHDPKCTGSTCLCPECGAEAEALHVSKIRDETFIEKNYFIVVYNIRGHFVALSWILFKNCGKDGRIIFHLQKYEGIALIGGRPIRYTGCVQSFNVTWLKDWVTRAVWRDNGDEWDVTEIFMNRADFDKSDASKSGLEEYIAREQKKVRIGAYLQIWCKHPQIENLVRSGLAPFVRKLINKATIRSGYFITRSDFSIKEAEMHFDRKKVKPHEMLGVEKEELPLANKWSIDEFDLYKKLRDERGVKLTERQMETVRSYGCYNVERFFKEANEKLGYDAPIVRTLNYMQKAGKNAMGLQYLLDYWEMTKEIQGGLPPELLYPKDLQRAHDLAVLRKEEKVNQEIDRNIKKYAGMLGWMTFEDEETGLLIRVAKSQSELIKEGKFLSHCVGTYAKSVSERKTAIFFIRHAEDPDTPFFTLEYRDGKVMQNRGKGNCARTPEVEAFEKKWLNYIDEHKKGKKYGKRTASTEHRAGA